VVNFEPEFEADTIVDYDLLQSWREGVPSMVEFCVQWTEAPRVLGMNLWIRAYPGCSGHLLVSIDHQTVQGYAGRHRVVIK
jgi:hypothetical protein